MKTALAPAFRPLAAALLLALAPLGARAQATADETFAQIEQAIRNADAPALARHFKPTVEVTIEDADQDYAKNQAQFVIKEFFVNYPVRAFSIVHKGVSGDTHYAVCTYESTRGAFDTNIFLKKQGGAFLVEHIRFERDSSGR